MPRRRDEAGVVLPTRVLVASMSFVALAGLAYLATQPDQPTEAAPIAAEPTPTEKLPTGVEAPKPTPEPQPKPKPAVKRSAVYVEVYNNSNIKGLAGDTAARATAVGWNVVGSDNWYGTVDGSTVYYPPKFKAAAQLLGKDLDIARLKPAVDPMRFDRLTVILTADYR